MLYKCSLYSFSLRAPKHPVNAIIEKIRLEYIKDGHSMELANKLIKNIYLINLDHSEINTGVAIIKNFSLTIVRMGVVPSSVSGLSALLVFNTFNPEAVCTSQAQPELRLTPTIFKIIIDITTQKNG